jgi:hypothetical protein
MRCGVIVAAALVAMGFAAVSPSGAQAQEYCGYTGHPGAIVQCGYSSLEGCENTIGKGAMCFVNPYVALNTRNVRSKIEG